MVDATDRARIDALIYHMSVCNTIDDVDCQTVIAMRDVIETLRAEVRAAEVRGMRRAAEIGHGVGVAFNCEVSRHPYPTKEHDKWLDRWMGANDVTKAINAAADELEAQMPAEAQGKEKSDERA